MTSIILKRRTGWSYRQWSANPKVRFLRDAVKLLISAADHTCIFHLPNFIFPITYSARFPRSVVFAFRIRSSVSFLVLKHLWWDIFGVKFCKFVFLFIIYLFHLFIYLFSHFSFYRTLHVFICLRSFDKHLHFFFVFSVID